MDRLGQTRVLRAAAAGHVPALTALVDRRQRGRADLGARALRAVRRRDLPAGPRRDALAVERAGRGRPSSARPPTRWCRSSSRSRWSRRRRSSPRSWRSARPQVAVLVAAALGAGARDRVHDDARPRAAGAATPHDVGWLGPLGAAGMRTVFGVLVAFGTAVGIVQVAVPAFAAERGSAATGGVLLAALSAGSLIGGLVYGARPWPGSPPRAARRRSCSASARLRAAGRRRQRGRARRAARAQRAAPGARRRSIGSTLLDTVAPSGTVTEAFTVMVMAIVVGTAVGNAARRLDRRVGLLRGRRAVGRRGRRRRRGAHAGPAPDAPRADGGVSERIVRPAAESSMSCSRRRSRVSARLALMTQ